MQISFCNTPALCYNYGLPCIHYKVVAVRKRECAKRVTTGHLFSTGKLKQHLQLFKGFVVN